MISHIERGKSFGSKSAIDNILMKIFLSESRRCFGLECALFSLISHDYFLPILRWESGDYFAIILINLNHFIYDHVWQEIKGEYDYLLQA